MKKYLKLFLLSLSFSLLFFSCEHSHQKAKYVFLFIGDGMGQGQVNAAEAYQAAIQKQIGFEHFAFTQFPASGHVSTFANNRFITASAAAGTALASGKKTNIGRIGMNPDATEPYESIAEKCKAMGMNVGIVSSVSLDHATPAAFYAHQPSRSNYFEIGLELAHSNFDFFGGGGFRSPDGEVKGKHTSVIDQAKMNEFEYINTMEGFNSLSKSDRKVIATSNLLEESGAMRYAIDLNETNLQLSDFTAKAIELLEDEKGFFIMVEGGKIDWACHANDAATSIHETIAFSNAVDVAIEFYKAHPEETLIVVTADHETGGMTIGNEPSKYETDLSILQHQIISSQAFVEVIRDFRVNLTGDMELDFKHMMEIMDWYFGLGNPDKIPLTEKEISTIKKSFITSLYTSEGTEPDHAYHDEEPLANLLNQMMSDKAGIGWTSYSHTGVNVPVYATGVGAGYFSTSIDNTDIPKIIEEIIAHGVH
jgi:alkaline phosphatase